MTNQNWNKEKVAFENELTKEARNAEAPEKSFLRRLKTALLVFLLILAAVSIAVQFIPSRCVNATFQAGANNFLWLFAGAALGALGMQRASSDGQRNQSGK